MLRMPYSKSLKLPLTFPTPLSKSRDYNAIEYLLFTIFYYFYTESTESRNIHNPHRCNIDLLPMLADYYRYELGEARSIELEREIIATVPELHHNKGCVIGINNALELSKVDKTSDIRIPWFYQKDENIITVILSRDTKIYKMQELLKLVVPIGTKVIIKPGYFIQASEEVKLHSWTNIAYGDLDPNKQYCITPNNYWHTVWDPEKQMYSSYVDEQWALSNPENTFDVASTRIGNTEIASNNVKDTIKDEE